MKKLICATLIALAIFAFVYAPSPTLAAAEGGTITGTGQGLFPAGTSLGAVTLSSLQLGTGVIVDSDNSAVGSFHVVLSGQTLLGKPQQITVEGLVTQGAVSENGTASFSGVASVDLGTGAPLQAGVPFSVTTSANSLTLALGSETLAPASLTGAGVTIE